MKKIKIVIGRHSFKVILNDASTKVIIHNFNKQFQTYKKDMKQRRIIVVKDKLFITCNEIFKEYYYPITVLNSLGSSLHKHGMSSSDVEIVYRDKPKRFRVDLNFIFKHALRDYQNKYVRTMSKSLKKNHTFLVDLQTGKGKGVIACKTIAKIGYRTGILILPKYINKWKKELREYFELKENDIFCVQGGDSLIELMEMDKEELPKFIIFSIRTMYFYLKEYELLQFKDHFKFPILPNDLLDKLNMSTLLVDETHQEFHAVYKLSLALDPTLLIGLSATLVNKDKKVNKLYELLYPNEVRLSYLEVDKYQTVIAVRYNLPLPKQFKYINGSYGYSQTKFEESLLKFKSVLVPFMQMLNRYLDNYFIKRRKKGQKCLIFFGSVDMCTYVTNLYKVNFPKLNVCRYTSGDSYDEMISSDIIVTTPGSAGTALDIPGLITVLSPFNTSSTQLNLQMLGRLREIKGVEVMFIYFYCGQIEQHGRYHDERYHLFSDRVKQYKQLMHVNRK